MDQREFAAASKRLQSLYGEIAKSITSSLESSAITYAIMQQVHSFFKPDNWSLLLLDPKSNELYFVVAEGLDSGLTHNLRIKLGEGVAGHVAKTGLSIYLPDVAKSHYFNKKVDCLSGFKTHSLVAVPIVFQQQVLGVIELINIIQDDAYRDGILEILETIADFAAIALNNAMIHEQVIFLATHDSLTELYNRCFLNKLLADCCEGQNPRLSEKTHSVAVLIDVNSFKQINDQRGHAAGDEVLVRLAKYLKVCCQQNDFIFRIGGDEFLIIIKDIAPHEVEVIKQKTQEKLSMLLNEIIRDFSFSFGLAGGETSKLKDVILAADTCMYQLKQASKKSINEMA